MKAPLLIKLAAHPLVSLTCCMELLTGSYFSPLVVSTYSLSCSRPPLRSASLVVLVHWCTTLDHKEAAESNEYMLVLRAEDLTEAARKLLAPLSVASKQ